MPSPSSTGLLDSGPRTPCASSSGRLHTRTDAFSLATEPAVSRPVIGRPCLPCRCIGLLHSDSEVPRLQADPYTTTAAWLAAGRPRLPRCCPWALLPASSSPDLERPAPFERSPAHPDTFTIAAGSAAALLAADRPRLPRRYARRPRLRTSSANLPEDAPRASSSSDLVRPHRRLLTYALGPPRGVVPHLLRTPSLQPLQPPQLRTSSALHPSSDRLHIQTLSPSPPGRLPPCSRLTANTCPAATPGFLDFEPRVRIFRRMPLEPLRPRTSRGHAGARSPTPWGHHAEWCRSSCGWLPAPSLPPLRPHQPRTSRAGAGVFSPPDPRAYHVARQHASSPPPYLPRPTRPRDPPPGLPPAPRAALFQQTCHPRPHPGLPLPSFPVGMSRAIPVPDDAWELLLHLLGHCPHRQPAVAPHSRTAPSTPTRPHLGQTSSPHEPHVHRLNESAAARGNPTRPSLSVDPNSTRLQSTGPAIPRPPPGAPPPPLPFLGTTVATSTSMARFNRRTYRTARARAPRAPARLNQHTALHLTA